MSICLSPTLSLHGFPEWGTGHTYQLLDRRLNLSLFSTPDTYGGPRDRKIEFSEGITFWSQGQTSLFPRQRPPRALTSPIFPRFLGKEAIVTLRRDAGYRGERSMIRNLKGAKGVTSSVRCLPPTLSCQEAEAHSRKNHLSKLFSSLQSVSRSLGFVTFASQEWGLLRGFSRICLQRTRNTFAVESHCACSHQETCSCLWALSLYFSKRPAVLSFSQMCFSFSFVTFPSLLRRFKSVLWLPVKGTSF